MRDLNAIAATTSPRRVLYKPTIDSTEDLLDRQPSRPSASRLFPLKELQLLWEAPGNLTLTLPSSYLERAIGDRKSDVPGAK